MSITGQEHRMTTRNGIPVMGLGTYQRLGPEGCEAIRVALEIGYRHLDTAQSYDTEENVAEAIRRSGVPRGEVFITTKVATTNLARGAFLPSVEKSLKRLATERIDLTLIHWPSPNDAVPFEHYIEDLGTAQERGWTRLIGVSNFPIALLKKAEAILGKGRLATNQVEVHPFLQNRTLRDWCDGAGISVTAYMPLAKGRVAADPVLRDIAAARNATPGQIALAFLLQEGLIVIPASSRRDNLAANFAATGIVLSAEEIARVRALDRHERMINPASPPAWDR
ncbi:aldo/keto reductase [Alsobacter sp. SYSU M60028]|uniref:Aldo/keto reductase n=1 Tax=Alsobacter ponti TaxID=2962936 RepID=A0ABT1L6L2_9HYPH|nr:aldo/keto reductase [Alsobacter ponti]MCP8936939.1 aldo/keto reductase [Alsobacter ponti]